MKALWILYLGLCTFTVRSDEISVEEIQSGKEYVRAVFDDTERIRKESMPQMPTVTEQKEVCFPEIGCFSKVDGPFSFTKTMPESPEQIRTTFSLFTAQNLNEPQLLSYLDQDTLSTTLLDSEQPLAVISHGLNEDGNKKWIKDVKEALLNEGYGSVIVVDWSRGSYLPFYGQAMVNSEVVGRQLAYILELLHEKRGIRLDQVYLVGYSLGAHLIGFAGKNIFSKLGQKVGRITGIDPAGPTFEDKTEKTHLSYQDATYVDVIHTSGGGISILVGDLGLVKPIGHVDFYPNGGSDQPGCSWYDVVCSHRRGFELYIESMSRTTSCTFNSYPCPGGYKDFKAGNCTECGEGGCGTMGFFSQNFLGRGKLFLKTNENPPFCINEP